MNYFFWVKETDKHDRELAIVEADSLKKAEAEFAGDHPEDVQNLSEVYEEDSFLPIKEY